MAFDAFAAASLVNWIVLGEYASAGDGGGGKNSKASLRLPGAERGWDGGSAASATAVAGATIRGAGASSASAPMTAAVGTDDLSKSVQSLSAEFDSQYGGSKVAPAMLKRGTFSFREGRSEGDAAAVAHATGWILRAMASPSPSDRL